MPCLCSSEQRGSHLIAFLRYRRHWQRKLDSRPLLTAHHPNATCYAAPCFAMLNPLKARCAVNFFARSYSSTWMCDGCLCQQVPGLRADSAFSPNQFFRHCEGLEVLPIIGGTSPNRVSSQACERQTNIQCQRCGTQTCHTMPGGGIHCKPTNPIWTAPRQKRSAHWVVFRAGVLSLALSCAETYCSENSHS